ncbi:2-hydroxychromene-2-carboxylate isomerase [Sphingomonas sp.]|jgi:2-hydroxychromene-2-carboxylate isomerase|uniref:2-hydroxychromene-2-carboxylate isomerase n=1 Tax=Sphingomonas sp. TaxID=28214 RepID=UPI002D7EC8D5|nr:2-hydroxychromene-2-carboxylate isomerase [Sphingomonas sp.]HEU0045921.1 2-hydroxychromene-2-carboxylate isomerase [Sphingomonas sp.]
MAPVFLFDFGSPNAWFAHRLIPDIEARTGARFVYRPVLLGGLFKLSGNQAPMIAFAGVPNKLAYERRETERFVARHGLTQFRMNPHFPVNTLMLMRAAVAAELAGLGAQYNEAMFRYMWEEPRKLDDLAVLAATMAEVGLDAEQLLTAAQTPAVKARLAANTQAAHDAGAFGIPSFLFGDELYFGKERLRDVEEALTHQP